VRDLEAVVKKAFVMSDARITPQAFAEDIGDSSGNNIEAILARGEIIKHEDFVRRVEEQERILLQRAMDLTDNKKGAAAALLGMNHNTMNYRRLVLRMEEGKQVASKAVAK
jgi:DNA-binding NtrC family response regulator